VLPSTSFTVPATVPDEPDGACYEVRAYWNGDYVSAQFCIPSPTPTPTPPPPPPTATPTFTATPTPSTRYIIVNPGSGQPASTTTVYGYNFVPDEAVTIEWPAVAQSSGPYTVGSTFVLTDTVPSADPGPYFVMARWGSGDQFASDLFVILELPTPTPTATPSTRFIEVEPGGGQSGSTTTVYGYDFLPEEAVTIEWPGTITPTLWIESGSANISGTFAIDVTVPYPDDPPGPYSVMARWGPGDQYASDLFIIEEPPTPTPTYPYLILSPDSGAFSTPFAIEGHNLMTEIDYSIWWDGTLTGITTTTNISGTFAGITYTVPVSTPGIYTVEAQDGITATAPFEVIAHGAIAGTTYVSEDGSWPGDATAGVTVAAYQEGELITDTLSVSDPLGSYILEDLPAGTYYVVATYQIYWAAGSVTVTGGTTTGRNFYLF